MSRFTSPFLVRPLRGEVSPQEIGGDVEGVITVGFTRKLSAADDLNTILTYGGGSENDLGDRFLDDAHHTALAEANAHFQFLGHPWAAIAAKAQTMLLFNIGQKHHSPPLAP